MKNKNDSLHFKKYADFVSRMEAITCRFLNKKELFSIKKEEVEFFINGANAKEISKHFKSVTRKEYGIFFTDDELAIRVAKRIKKELAAGIKIYDPACGSGDLLLACSKYMQKKDTLTKTLRFWSNRLSGQDIFKEFIRSAKSRLFLSCAFNFCTDFKHVVSGDNYFDNLIVKDFFKSNISIKNADCIVTNPPFSHVDLTGKVEWASGNGQLAGLFIDNLVKKAKNGQRIIAVLPDVLRSGSRYEKWRAFIASNASNINIEIYGRFSKEADVDVFILDFVVDKDGPCIKNNFETSNASSKNKISDIFKVSIGPVVPHRDLQDGLLVPYVDTQNSPLWAEITAENLCKYRCTLKKPPFVVLRRTSGPNDFPRLKSSIIKGNKPVAVENHLIVLEPKDGKLKTCREFMKIAKSIEATNWINNEIRCRHLTVSVIKKIPIFKFKNR